MNFASVRMPAISIFREKKRVEAFSKTPVLTYDLYGVIFQKIMMTLTFNAVGPQISHNS
jgi:hypothetical protein